MAETTRGYLELHEATSDAQQSWSRGYLELPDGASSYLRLLEATCSYLWRPEILEYMLLAPPETAWSYLRLLQAT